MKALKIIGWILLGLVVVIVLLGIFAPKEYQVERIVQINAPKEIVFPHVKYWRNWQAWLPWAKMDSTMTPSYEGNDGEPGAKYSWSGQLTGKGEMVNTGVKENEELLYHLKFIEPMESESDGYVRVTPNEQGCTAAWAFSGKSPFPWNILMLFMSMDKAIGKDFESGLALLKEIAEKEYAKASSYQILAIDFPAKTYAMIRQTVVMKDIPDFFTANFGLIYGTVTKQGGQPVGAPCGIYFSWDEKTQSTDMAAAVPIAKKKEFGQGIEILVLPKTKAYQIDYYGPYEKSMLAYLAFEKYCKENGLVQKSFMIEEYLTDPSSEPDQEKWLTRIYFFTE